MQGVERMGISSVGTPIGFRVSPITIGVAVTAIMDMPIPGIGTPIGFRVSPIAIGVTVTAITDTPLPITGTPFGIRVSPIVIGVTANKRLHPAHSALAAAARRGLTK